MGGDELTVVSGDATELVFESTVDAKQYACMLTFDEESDAFDCTAAITPGGTFVVSMGHDQGIACNSELMSSIAIPTGDPQACTFSCDLLP